MVYKVFRYDPESGKDPYYDEFQVPTGSDTTVLESLIYIFENLDSSLAYRHSCRASVCGSCGMKINGRFRLACRTLVKNLKSDIIIVEPLAHLPLIKDLIVDMSAFYEKYEIVEPYLLPKEISDQNKEFYQSPKDRKRLDGLVECILCGSCYASCTMCHWDPDFPGPSALLAVSAKLKDNRDKYGNERVAELISESGIWRCHTELNCTDVCPKDLSPTEAINFLKREACKYPYTSRRKKEVIQRDKDKRRSIPKSIPPANIGISVLNRRNFLRNVVIAGAGILSAGLLGIFSIPFLKKQTRGWVDDWIEIDYPELKPGMPVEIIYERKKWEKGELRSFPQRAYVVKNKSGEVNALDPRCTHLGCICYWEESIRMFLCPCHGGAFNIDGDVTLGPPPRPLAQLEIRIQGNHLYIRKRKES